MDIVNRELSWLSFNERVLQEAMDDQNPLIERMRFLGIYSNNMDEFFRVRVANLRRMIFVKKKSIDGYPGTPQKLYKEIRKIVLKQQTKFVKTYEQLVTALKEHQIFMLDENHLTNNQLNELNQFFHERLKHDILPILFKKETPFPKLKDSSIYLAIKMHVSSIKSEYALIQIPEDYNRFYTIQEEDRYYVILLDDIIRLYLNEIFSLFKFAKIEAFTFKFSRDAELDLDDDIQHNYLEKLEKSLKQRKFGQPVRFVYDQNMPVDLLAFLLDSLHLKLGENTIPGGRYHNFKDFMAFPDFQKAELLYKKQSPLEHPDFRKVRSLIKTIQQKDRLLHFPYQKFDYVVDLIREAAIDPKVKAIKINIYRVAKSSQIMNALLSAAINGKSVVVFLELRARFDEEHNLYWTNKLKENGVKVIYGLNDLKVHSKLMQIERVENNKKALYSYVGTGNFNEKTAKIYTDIALLTKDKEIGQEVEKVFRILENKLKNGIFKQLLVSPFNARKMILHLIDQEIKQVKSGNMGSVELKLNNLTDPVIIKKLIDASELGVKVKLIIRGICCLAPTKKASKNIEVISIVDRYLEHARFMIFGNHQKPLYYLTSADFMERNLDKRIEVAAPIKDIDLQQELRELFDFQWKGSVKSRIIDKDMQNKYRKFPEALHAQQAIYQAYLSKVSGN